jgi:hypothetical protein
VNSYNLCVQLLKNKPGKRRGCVKRAAGKKDDGLNDKKGSYTCTSASTARQTICAEDSAAAAAAA